MDVPLVHIDCSGIDYIAMNGLVKSYSGAKPGKVVDGLFEKGATDVLVLLDEVDKMGRSKEGDPYGALIKPLGPHRKYFDEFVADDIDVSATKFIATANDVSQIPGYILSRFQNCVFYIDAYTPEEKVEIATNYVIPKCLKIYNLADEECRFDGEAVRLIVDEFCHDEGIRELEGNIVLLLRKAITEYARGIIQKPMHIDCEYVRSHLKKNKVTKGKNTAGFAS
jgi:ATP-dependent Lon protease